jgi:RNA polymerase sigma-70 factor, ECF subfamily
MAFLVLLERLSPVERAVFLLRDVFDYPFDEIAAIVDKSEENCRQIAVRARRHVQDGKPRFDDPREQREALARRFFAGGQVVAVRTVTNPDKLRHLDEGPVRPQTD